MRRIPECRCDKILDCNKPQPAILLRLVDKNLRLLEIDHPIEQPWLTVPDSFAGEACACRDITRSNRRIQVMDHCEGQSFHQVRDHCSSPVDVDCRFTS